MGRKEEGIVPGQVRLEEEDHKGCIPSLYDSSIQTQSSWGLHAAVMGPSGGRTPLGGLAILTGSSRDHTLALVFPLDTK